MMNWREFFKPTIGKITFSIIVVLIWYWYFKYILVGNKHCELIITKTPLICSNLYPFLLIDTCPGSGGCITVNYILWQYLFIIIIPIMIAYVAYSLLSLLKFKK